MNIKNSKRIVTGKSNNIHIIGGGPAGLSAAYELSKNGKNVTVYEQFNYKNKEKICGDGLTPRAINELKKIGIQFDNPIFHKINGLKVNRGPLLKEITINWDSFDYIEKSSYSCMRKDLDNLLYKNALMVGVSIKENTKVESLKQFLKNDYVLLAAGASGTNKLLKSIGIIQKNRIEGVAVRAYFLKKEKNNYIKTFLPYNGEYGGYVWVFPLPNGKLNVGMGTMSDNNSPKKINLMKEFNQWILENKKIIGKQITSIKGDKLPMGIKTPLVSNNIILLGDSAGLISPFNGEGVSYAISSGLIASKCIIDNRVNDYEKIIRKKYGGYFSMGLPFIKIINNKSLMKFCVKYGLRSQFSQKWTSIILSHLYTKKNAGALNIIEKICKFIYK